MRFQAVRADPLSGSVFAHFVGGCSVDHLVLGTIGVVAEPGLFPGIHATLFGRSWKVERRADAPGDRGRQEDGQHGLQDRHLASYGRARLGIDVCGARTWTSWLQQSGPFRPWANRLTWGVALDPRFNRTLIGETTGLSPGSVGGPFPIVKEGGKEEWVRAGVTWVTWVAGIWGGSVLGSNRLNQDRFATERVWGEERKAKEKHMSIQLEKKRPVVCPPQTHNAAWLQTKRKARAQD